MERERQARWDYENMCTAATKLRSEKYFLLRALCVLQDITVYELIKNLLEDWIEQACAGMETDEGR